MSYFEKHAGVLEYFGKGLQLAGKHPKASLGVLGSLIMLSQIPRMANKALGTYLIGSESNKRKIMNKQTALLQQLTLNTQPVKTKIDPRRIPVREPLI